LHPIIYLGVPDYHFVPNQYQCFIQKNNCEPCTNILYANSNHIPESIDYISNIGCSKTRIFQA
jgi:hypothetical protein